MSEKSNVNLDLIQMVQRARMQHDHEAVPSQIAGNYWIEAKCLSENCQQPTVRSGQWVLSTMIDVVDALWEQLKTATEAGQLGYKAKVSTASRDQADVNQRVLVVCTYDCEDQADVQRVRQALRDIGLDGDWQYKTD